MVELRSYRLQELTWEDVEDYLEKEDIIIFPVGSTEQYHEYMVQNLVEFIEWLRRYDGPVGQM